MTEGETDNSFGSSQLFRVESEISSLGKSQLFRHGTIF